MQNSTQNKTQNKINTVIENAIKNLSEIIDINSVIGKPVKTDNSKTIIPVCKVSIAFMNGAGEYGKVKIFQKSGESPLAGGSGGYVSIKPMGFLVESETNYKFVSASNEPYEKILDTANDFLEKLREN